MKKSAPLTNSQGDVRELKAEDLEGFRGFASLPSAVQQKLGLRGPQKAPTKQRVTIRLSQNVVDSFRSGGAGWQTRVDAALQDWLKKHKVTV